MLTLMLGVLALSATAFAHGGPGDNDGHKKGHKHGHIAKRTFTVTTTDNGSCGAAWATDTVKRTFLVKKNRDGSYTLARLDRGRFVTLAGQSPGACDTTGDHGQTIWAGVHGFLVGYIRGTVTGGTFDKNATCTGDDCGFTDVFLKTFLGPRTRSSRATRTGRAQVQLRLRRPEARALPPLAGQG